MGKQNDLNNFNRMHVPPEMMSERPYKILVTDDDEAVRESLRKLLTGEGYQVLAVANGAEALETFRWQPEPIDLLLLDLNMPLKNGWATLDRLMEINPSVPVLIVTGQPNQFELAEAAGVSALVQKPIDVPALLQFIQKLLAGTVESRRQPTSHCEFPFRFVSAASYSSRHPWPEQHVTRSSHWGLNE
jgi:CheY-like chemotaxis protein